MRNQRSSFYTVTEVMVKFSSRSRGGQRINVWRPSGSSNNIFSLIAYLCFTSSIYSTETVSVGQTWHWVLAVKRLVNHWGCVEPFCSYWPRSLVRTTIPWQHKPLSPMFYWLPEAKVKSKPALSKWCRPESLVGEWTAHLFFGRWWRMGANQWWRK